MSVRILILANDPQYSRWLQHRIETFGGAFTALLRDLASVQSGARNLTRLDCDLLIAVLNFRVNEDESSEGLLWLRDTVRSTDAPPLLVIAENGDELSAVQALRMGATDYLPRTLLTADRLVSCLHRCLVPTIAPLGNNGLPRDLVPGYTLLKKLGESTRAQVFLAHSTPLGRNVALKVSRDANDALSNAAFQREYAAIKMLRHPAVVDIYDHGVHEGCEYIAMEYFPCGDLRARLQNPISVPQSLDYLQRIATALSVVHRAGIVHRDLKPPNIMLRENSQAVLIDFGLARNLQNEAQWTQVGTLQGSPYYMSPEQAQGLQLDGRSDLYGLGIILFEMLTGYRPFTGSTAVEVLQKHLDAPLPVLPAELSQHQPLINGLLAKEPSDRYSSADDLLRALAVAA